MSLEDIFLELTTDDAADDAATTVPETGDDAHGAETEDRIDG